MIILKKLIIEERVDPCLNSIVKDWLEAIGGPQFVEHVYSVCKDMKTQTLGSLQSQISNNFTSFLTEINEI